MFTETSLVVTFIIDYVFHLLVFQSVFFVSVNLMKLYNCILDIIKQFFI